MYVFQSAGQLSIEEFYVPFGGKLDPGNRWVVLAVVIPWEPLENQYAPLFNAKTGAPAKPFRMALGALYIQQRLGVSDREIVELITESPYLQFFIGLSGFQYLKPFDSSMLVHCRKRIGPDLIKVCNDMTKANGIAMIQELLASSQEEKTDAEQTELEVCQPTLKTAPPLCIIKCYLQLVSRQDWSFPLSASPFQRIASTPAAALLGLFAIP